MQDETPDNTDDVMPTSTQWTIAAADNIDKFIVPNVFMIICSDTKPKGSGFLLKNGYIVTNLWHSYAAGDVLYDARNMKITPMLPGVK
jgi:hypothetical protein